MSRDALNLSTLPITEKSYQDTVQIAQNVLNQLQTLKEQLQSIDSANETSYTTTADKESFRELKRIQKIVHTFLAESGDALTLKDFNDIMHDGLNEEKWKNSNLGKLQTFVTDTAAKAADMIKTTVGQNELLCATWNVVAKGCKLIKTMIEGMINNAIAGGEFALAIKDFGISVKHTGETIASGVKSGVKAVEKGIKTTSNFVAKVAHNSASTVTSFIKK